LANSNVGQLVPCPRIDGLIGISSKYDRIVSSHNRMTAMEDQP
jgi:hypothetical protein